MSTRHTALSILERLLDAPSVSGSEAALAAVVRAYLDEYGVGYETDAAGNVLVRLPGSKPDAPLVCLAAHMDEIGMFVSAVEADGSLRVDRSGGLHPYKLGEGPVEIVGDRETLLGVISMGSTHTADAAQRTVTWDGVKVITGRTPDELTAAGIRPGTTVAPHRAMRGPVLLGHPDDPLVAAWTLDDRAGVMTLLRLLETMQDRGLQPHQPTLIAFTVGEEVGGLGAKALCHAEQPAVFVAVDGAPTPPEVNLALDGRPAIWTRDRLGPYDQRLVRDFMDLAEAAGTALQPASYASAASDASLVHYAGLAPRIACVGHVRENSHGYEVARLRVFDNVLNVLLEFIANWEIG
jgi:putative aminopeptidase FrvX